MAEYSRIKGNHKKIDIGELKHRIEINLRSIQAPNSGVDFDENFSDTIRPFAMIKSIAPKEIVNGTNIEGVATHLIGIRYKAGITTQNWIKFDNEFYKILKTDDGVSTNKRYLLMYCCLRGDADLEVNYV